MANVIANLSDVAEKAGVSKSTVSRVLNNKLGNGFSVKEDVRCRVIDVARELNYRPNLIAQSLTKQQTRMISILGGSHALSDLGNIYQTVVNNVTAVLDGSPEGFDVMVDMSRHNKDRSELPSWRIDGAVVLATCSKETMKELEETGTPYVVVNGPAGPGGLQVIPDDVEGMRLAMKHLIDLGHTKIAYAGPKGKALEGHSSLRDRHDTYLSEVENYGLYPMVGHDDVLGAADEFLESTVISGGATAVIAYGHMGGLNLMQAAHRLGIGVPEHFSLICFCDEYANSVMSPSLTFVDLRTREMGLVAAELLLSRIRGQNEFDQRSACLDERLVVCASTAVPFGQQ